jgi:ppGpp synthetase/RelA/SpoT-type nucleotidyltranferase
MMKVPPSLRLAFEKQSQINEALQASAEEVIAGFRRPHWHYEGRLKGLESFALKVESGRVADPMAMEDFFACTLVVRNASEVPAAETAVLEHFRLQQRRPADPAKTHKSPDAFPFDDLRLYVTLKPSELTPPTDLSKITFEIQIKTFLQHAWSIATHDLLYKSSDVRWAKARIAFQIKAMLEHAELAIEEVEPLASAKVISRTDVRTTEIAALINAQERLPTDVKRLAENLLAAFRTFRAEPQEFGALVDAETAEGRGINALNLSPYAATIQALILRRTEQFSKFLNQKSKRNKLAIPADIDVPDGLDWPPRSDQVVMI